MTLRSLTKNPVFPVCLILAAFSASACKGGDTGENPSDSNEEVPTTEETSSTSETTATSEETLPVVGNELGDPIPLDHETVAQTVRANLDLHFGGLQSAIAFLEDSQALDHIVDMIFGEEEDDYGYPIEEPLDLDLSEIQDEVVSIVLDRILVEQAATVAADGLSLAYRVDGAFACPTDPDDIEEGESPEDEQERLEDEAACMDRLADHPIDITVMSDGAGRMNLGIAVDEGASTVFDLQVHDDQMSAMVAIEHVGTFLASIVDPDDFALAETLSGEVGGEIRRDAPAIYSAWFAIYDNVRMTPGPDQETFMIELDQNYAPGAITLDGDAMTLSGALQLGSVKASMPWQTVVELFYDDEGHWEGEVWIDPPTPPEVTGHAMFEALDVAGILDYIGPDDTLSLSAMGLGDDTAALHLDGQNLVEIDLNPNDSRTLDLTMRGGLDELHFGFSPVLDAHLYFGWHVVKDVIDDLPRFMLDETISAHMVHATAPEIRLFDLDDDTQVQVSQGTLTLSSTEMTEDVVIQEGECITMESDDTLTDEEKDALHELFGEMVGATCE